MSLHQSSEFTGGHSRVEIPVPFPNTEVKRSNVDGTAACPWESRKLPVFFISKSFKINELLTLNIYYHMNLAFFIHC